MRRFWFFTIIGFLLAIALGSYAARRYFARSLTPGRHLIVPHGPLNMGFIAPNSKARIHFTVYNAGTEPLEIKKVFANCGCTVATINKKILKSGQATTVHVVFHSSGYWRGVQKDVYLVSNDSRKPLQTVVLMGYVRVGTRLDVNTLDLGSGKFGAKLGPKAVHIFADAGLHEGTVRLTGKDTGMKLRGGAWRSVDEGQAQRCTLWIRSGPLKQEPGAYTRKVLVRVGDTVKLPLQVTYVVKPMMFYKPLQVDLRPGKGPKSSALVHLGYAGHRMLIDSISSSFGYCLAKLVATGHKGAELRIVPNSSDKTLRGDALDIVRVTYNFDRGIRRETLNIPVVLTR